MAKGRIFYYTAVATDISAPQVYPWTQKVDVFNTPSTQTNWSSITVNFAYPNRAVVSSSGAQNDEIGWDLMFDASGTYVVDLIYRNSFDSGIFTINVGGIDKATIDAYDVDLVNKYTTSSSFQTSPTGKVRLKLIMKTKNGGSSNYFGNLLGITVRRTL